MNRLGDAPTDLLFGLIALHNDLVAPAVIPAALKAQALEPGRTLADLLVAKGALTPAQRDLVETLSGEVHQAAWRRRREEPGHSDRDSLGPRAAGSARRPRADRPASPPSVRCGSTVASGLDPRLDDLDCTLAPPANSASRPKSQIAGYEILEVLGVGGMGIVYKARQPRLDRFVALKMIRAGADARPEDLVRFETEAKAVAAIEHANIVKIFEIGEHDGLPYFSLEYPRRRQPRQEDRRQAPAGR